MLGDVTTKHLHLENRTFEDYLDTKLREYDEYMLTTIPSVLRVDIFLYNIYRYNKRTEMIDLKFTFLLLSDWIRLQDLRYDNLLGSSGAAEDFDLSSSFCLGCSAVELHLGLVALLLGCCLSLLTV